MSLGNRRCTVHPTYHFHQEQRRCDVCGTELVPEQALPNLIWRVLKILRWNNRIKKVPGLPRRIVRRIVGHA